ncbi:MAG: CpsD/CapB family tyrosine-protein kinase [Ornithinimicrobium sp.]
MLTKWRRSQVIRSRSDLLDAGDCLVLGEVTDDEVAANSSRIVIEHSRHRRSREFRELSTSLVSLWTDQPSTSIMFTSALPREGKTVTIAHLALTLGLTDCRVCLVEGNLRHPEVLDYLGMEGSVGLTNVLIGEADLDDMLQPYADTNLTVLGSGRRPPNPTQLVGSLKMRSLMHELSKRFDIVMVDAPSLESPSEAHAWAGLTERAVLVTRVGLTTHIQFRQGLARMPSARSNPPVVIVNRLPSVAPR